MTKKEILQAIKDGVHGEIIPPINQVGYTPPKCKGCGGDGWVDDAHFAWHQDNECAALKPEPKKKK